MPLKCQSPQCHKLRFNADFLPSPYFRRYDKLKLMIATPVNEARLRDETERCLALSLAATLAEEPALEAVTIDRARQKISVATIGRTDVEKLTARITHQLTAAQAIADQSHCSLLAGKRECGNCDQPLPENVRKLITIRTEGDATTIARVTCPTAPKFWRWRDIPFPKVVPRKIEIHDDDQHADEWKYQLVAAILCGVCGLLAAFALHGPFRTAAFVPPFNSRGFFFSVAGRV